MLIHVRKLEHSGRKGVGVDVKLVRVPLRRMDRRGSPVKQNEQLHRDTRNHTSKTEATCRDSSAFPKDLEIPNA